MVHTGRCLVMNTPTLKSFDITDYSGEFWSIENMPCLKAARIDIDYYFPNIIFLTSLSSILSLELRLNIDQDVTLSLSFTLFFVPWLSTYVASIYINYAVLFTIAVVCFNTIKFSRLTNCKILPYDSDWMDSLVPFLQNTLKLKSLIVDYVRISSSTDLS